MERLRPSLREAALSTPHSDAIFSFTLHEMECLISVSLTHPVMCLCGFVTHAFQESKGNVSPKRKKIEVKRPTQPNVKLIIAYNIHAKYIIQVFSV